MGSEKPNLHKGQEMEESRVRIPFHSAPTHPIISKTSPPTPGELLAGMGMQLLLQGSQQQANHTHPGELHWDRTTEEEAGKHTPTDHCTPTVQAWSPSGGKGKRKQKKDKVRAAL